MSVLARLWLSEAHASQSAQPTAALEMRVCDKTLQEGNHSIFLSLSSKTVYVHSVLPVYITRFRTSSAHMEKSFLEGPLSISGDDASTTFGPAGSDSNS